MTGSAELARAFVAVLDDAALDVLAERLAPRLANQLAPRTTFEEGWLDSKGAASYLGITVNALHKPTAARAIPFEQEGPGCKCWFKRSDLDRWRQAGSVRAVCVASTLLPQHREHAR